jgi:hypothetical protein
MSVNVILVDKTGVLKSVGVKDFKEEDLFKKAGFKKPDGFKKQTEWNVKLKDKRYFVSVYAKTDGRANTENKYDFPPPIDTTLYFGACVIVCKECMTNKDVILCDLSLELWEKIYEKLFGGFEDLALTCIEDEAEEDELANIPAEKKTKNGYLKDGFVVDSDEDEDDDDIDDSSSEFEDEEEDETDVSGEQIECVEEDDDDDESEESELEEEDYEK